jgi:hypothetical protein
MSIEQLAIDTKIPRPSIEALEEDRFGALPGPVFVRGFFRCCARSLGLDPEVVVGLLHDWQRASAQQAKKNSGRRERMVAVQASRPSGPEMAVRGAPAARGPALAAAPAEPTRAAANAAAASAPTPNLFADLGPALLRALSQLPQSRTLMWIAVCLVIAVIAVTAFAMSGIQVAAPHS